MVKESGAQGPGSEAHRKCYGAVLSVLTSFTVKLGCELFCDGQYAGT